MKCITVGNKLALFALNLNIYKHLYLKKYLHAKIHVTRSKYKNDGINYTVGDPKVENLT